LANTGPRTADEVVQVYIHRRYGSAARPVRELKGFRRVTLAAGETRQVTFTLRDVDLAYWSAASRCWVNEPGEFDVFVGADSTAQLATRFQVEP
jgi:beta-glucosidase